MNLFKKFMKKGANFKTSTGLKVFKCGVSSGPYFPIFRLNKDIYGVNLRIQSKY